MSYYEFCFISFLLALNYFFRNSYSRRGIYFGVILPEGAQREADFAAVSHAYRAIVVAVFALSVFFVRYLPRLYYYAFFANMVIMEICTFVAHVAVRRIKAERGFKDSGRITIDTDISHRKLTYGNSYFKYYAIPFSLCVFNALFVFAFRNYLPDSVPIQFSFFSGEPSFIKRTGAVTLKLAFEPLLVAVLAVLMNIGVLFMKQDIRFSGKKASEPLIRSRRIWTVYLILMCSSQSLISIFNIYAMIKGKSFNAISVAFRLHNFLFFIVVPFYLVFFVGTTGEALRRDEKTVYRDDDKNWFLMSSFYFNREDPSIIVPRRVGLGFTFNMASKFSYLILFMFLFSLFILRRIL